MKNNKLNFFVPFEENEYIEKAAHLPKSDRYDNMYLQGVASDGSKDSDEEEIDPNGLVFDRFLSEGLINYEHLSKSGGPRYFIGEPVEAKVQNGKFFIKAKLWKGNDIAENLWDTLLIMKANNSKRKLGWSIEGKTLERNALNNKKINKAMLTHCAVTFMPKNYNTYADIIKGEQKYDYIIPEVELSDSKYIYEFEDGGKVYGITKSFEIEEKAVDTTNSAALRRESLDEDVKNLLQKALRKKLISPKKVYYFLKKF